MISFRIFFMILACLACLVHPATAQDAGGYDEEIVMEEIVLSPEMREFLADKIETFSLEIQNLLESVDGAQESQLKAIKRYVNAHDLKWTSFSEPVQDLIASDDELLSSVVRYRETRQKTAEAIEAREKTLKQMTEFVVAERTIAKHVKQCEKTYKEAFSYSLLEKMTPDLEKLKAKDLLLMEELTKHYEAARQAANDNKVLTPRWEKLDSEFITIRSYSQQMQQLEYKPLLQRVKDYILSLAAVAIILLFISFIVLRIKTIRDMKKAAEKARKLRELQNPNIPTI